MHLIHQVDKGLKDFASYSDVLAVANLTNSQTQTGWMYLEVKTREDANDVMQAKAAGVAEGYLTRYTPFYVHLCLLAFQLVLLSLMSR